MDFTQHLGELIGGTFLLVLAWSFRSWSTSIRSATNDILTKLDYLTKEFHQHRVDVERRVTRVETIVDTHLRHRHEDESI